MPVFSIIVPNYNHASFLEERIESILAQTFTDFELILLDDYSTDDSIRILEEYSTHPKVSRCVFNEKNSGSPFVQWAKGIDLAKANWIWIAESDDVADKEFLKTAFSYFQTHPDTGLFYCDAISRSESANDFYFSDQKNQTFSTKKWSENYIVDGKEEINQCLKYYCTINNASSMIFNKKLLKSGEIFAEFQYHGDWYFYLLLASKSKVCYCAKPLNVYRQHGNSFTNDFYGTISSKKDYFKILVFLLQLDFVHSKSKLTNHFAQYYLGAGFISNIFGKKPLLKQYWQINKGITIKVFLSILKLRAFGIFSKKAS
jgi:glycosyltransferase involved in cell wall biosynthesis